MNKETFYFSHDYNAMSDEKIKTLLYVHGLTGYGAYWAIIEMLYNNANALRTNYKSIAFDLHVGESFIKSIINDFDLFVINGEYFGSLSVERRLNERNEKSSKARESANYRWSKTKNDANALRSDCESNAIKEKKVKETKTNININTKTWRNDFDVYKDELRIEYNKLISDKDFITQQEKYYPGIDIKLSLEKACVNYWATEAGWKKKKSKREGSAIDWKATLTNAISLNKVHK